MQETRSLLRNPPPEAKLSQTHVTAWHCGIAMLETARVTFRQPLHLAYVRQPLRDVRGAPLRSRRYLVTLKVHANVPSKLFHSCVTSSALLYDFETVAARLALSAEPTHCGQQFVLGSVAKPAIANHRQDIDDPGNVILS